MFMLARMQTTMKTRKHISKGYINAVGALYGDFAPEEPIAIGSKPKPRKTRLNAFRRSEAEEQAMVVKYLRLLDVLFHSIPNGGKRSRWAGERERAMGLLKGAPDLFIAEANQGKHGFYVEMKAKGGKPRPEQVAFLEQARLRGYKAEWYDSFESAKVGIDQYLGLAKC